MNIAAGNNRDEIIDIATGQYLYVYNFACKLTNNRDSSLDFTQDTFKKAISKAHTFRDAPTVDNVRAWLSTIVKRTIIDAARKKNTRPIITGIKSHHKIIERQSDRYEMEDFHNAINKLPHPHKELITYLLIGYQYEELSLKFNLPIGSIKSHLFRAKVTLRKHMTELGYDKYYSRAKRNNIATEIKKQK